MKTVNTNNGTVREGYCSFCSNVTNIRVLEEFMYCIECGLTWVDDDD